MFENPTISLSVLCNLGVKVVCCLSWSSHLFIRVAASKMRAFHLMYQPFFSTLRSSSNPTNKNLTELGLEILVVNELDHNTSNIKHCHSEQSQHSTDAWLVLHCTLHGSSTARASEKREGRTARTRFKQLYLGNHSELGTCSYELLFSQWLILSPPKILTFPPESPCINHSKPNVPCSLWLDCGFI
jgi:hypothetical protein